jgi:16S rRNA (cytosine1402-N4)-methyltransferase
MGEPGFVHEPVLLEEVLGALAIRADGCYLDATFGRGGHTGAVLQRLGPAGRMLALDRDPAAIAAGRSRFADESRLQLMQRPFAELQLAVAETGLGQGFDGVLFDLGVSSPQLDDAARGFSFMNDGPLDMRMDNTSGQTAAAWLAKVSERDLLRVIREYGEEKFARRIAAALVQARAQQPITTTAQLAKLVSDAVPTREPGKHPATRTFQAIRIAVNAELEQIDRIEAGAGCTQTGWPVVRDQLSFARRSACQTLHAAAFAGRSAVCRFARSAAGAARHVQTYWQSDHAGDAEIRRTRGAQRHFASGRATGMSGMRRRRSPVVRTLFSQWAVWSGTAMVCRVAALERARDQPDTEWGQLLEQSTWVTYGRIEKIARDDLRMVVPDPTQVHLVEQP